MIYKTNGMSPRLDPTAWIAPNAVVSGDVTLGSGCRIMKGATVYGFERDAASMQKITRRLSDALKVDSIEEL